MDRDKLYESISARKRNLEHLRPYAGGNGRIDRFLDMIRRGDLPRGFHVLDVGGSHGDLVDISLRERLFEHGDVLDISVEACQIANQRGHVSWHIDVDRDGLRAQTGLLSGFDCISALDFIEHIVDPVGFARECYRALRSGGYVFINTPNISYWKNLESLVVRGQFPHTSGDTEVYHGGHLGFYNENDLFSIFSQAGFSSDRMRVWKDPDVVEPVPPIWSRLLSEHDQVKKDRMLSQPNLLFSCFKD